jgi:hypothetical protein
MLHVQSLDQVVRVRTAYGRRLESGLERAMHRTFDVYLDAMRVRHRYDSMSWVRRSSSLLAESIYHAASSPDTKERR